MVDVTEIGPEQRDLFDSYVENAPGGDFRQTYGWGEVRAADGWIPRRFLARRDGAVVGAASVLAGKLPHLPFNLLHAPCGPVADYSAPDLVAAFGDLFRRLGREARADLVRIEPPLPASDVAGHANLLSERFRPSGLPWSFWNAPLEVLRLDLTPSEEALLGKVAKDKRRYMTYFQRHGGTVEVSRDLEDFMTLHDLLHRLGEDKGFMVRGTQYWRSLWTEFATRGRGTLIVARSRHGIAGGIFTTICGRTCYLLHVADNPTACDGSHRPNEALYWASISHARSLGCTVYDMMGYVSESHLRFKRSFGSELAKLIGYYDLPGRPVRHWLFSALERRVLPWAVPLTARLQKMPRRHERPMVPPGEERSAAVQDGQ